MVPWLVVLAILAFANCALPWGIPTRFTIRPVSSLYYANDKKPVTAQELQQQEKKSRPFWGHIFDHLRKVVAAPEANDVAATEAKVEIEHLDKQLDAAMERGDNEFHPTIEQTFSFSPKLQRFHFSPSLQQIIREMKLRAEDDMKTVGTFFRGENGGAGADDAVRVVYRGEQEKEESEKEG